MPRKKQERSLRRTCAIVGDGHTEKAYFDAMKGFESISGLDIKPDLPRRSGGYEGVLEKCETLLEDGYDRVYAVIDLDEVITDRLDEPFNLELQRCSRKYGSRFNVIFCNPCFEIWILLHFEYTTRRFRRCGEVTNQIQDPKRLPDYQKGKKFIHKNHLYETLRPYLFSNAIPNAKRLPSKNPTQFGRQPVCTVYRIFDDLALGE